MTLRGKKVLVTGATGFIGGRLAEVLALVHGACVRAVVRDFRRAVRLGRFDVDLVQGELTDEVALAKAAEGCDVIFHCAFGASGSAAEQRKATVDGTRSVIAAAKRTNAKRLIHLSTLSVYGALTGGTLDESGPRQMTGDLYTDTKIEAEQLVADACRAGLPAVILQPTVVYGPFGGWWTAGQIERLRKCRLALPNGGDGTCNPVYVDDVVQAMLLAAGLEEGAAGLGETYLISGPESVSWRAYFGALESMLGVQSIVSLPLEEIRRRQREEAKAARKRGLFGWMLQTLRERPDVRQRIVQSPLGLPYRVAAKLTPARLMRAMKSRVLGAEAVAPAAPQGPRPGPGNAEQPPVDTRPIIVPDEATLPQFTAPTRVLIDKARRLLGYEPQYDLSRGMGLTAEWARWAGLV